MNAFTLACLLGTATSLKIMVDLSEETETHHANGTEKWVDPCPSSCGPDICASLTSPCDEFNVNEADWDLDSADMDWEAYEAAWKPYNDCWTNNPDASPWDACYTTGEYGLCLKGEEETMKACLKEAYGPMPTGDWVNPDPALADDMLPPDNTAPPADDMPAPDMGAPADDMPAPDMGAPANDMPAPDMGAPTEDPCATSDDPDACYGAAMDDLMNSAAQTGYRRPTP